MGDSDKTEDNAPAMESADSPSSLNQAREFLQNDTVRSESRERKMEFLKTKGFNQEQIIELLDSDAPTDTTSQVRSPEPPETL
jgi:peroxisomal membrane anchor protein 14 (PEX14)